MLPRVHVIDSEQRPFLLFATDDVISRAPHRSGAWEPWNRTLGAMRRDGTDLSTVSLLKIGAEGRTSLQQVLATLGDPPRLSGETGLAQHPDCARQFELIVLGDRQWQLERCR